MSDLIRRAVAVKTFTPVVTASSAYSANNCIGTLFEISGAVLTGSGFSSVKSILGLSKAKSDPACLLVLFSKKPAGTFTDKTAFDPSAADIALMTGVCTFGATWKDFATGSATNAVDLDSFVQALPDPSNPLPGISTSLWGILVATGTPTFSTVSDLTVKISLEQY